MEELNKLLGYISLDAKYKQELLYASLKQIHVKQKNHEWTFVLQNPTNFSSELFFALEDALKEFQEGVKISRDLEKKLNSAEETVAKLIDSDGTEHKLDPNNASAPEE